MIGLLIMVVILVLTLQLGKQVAISKDTMVMISCVTGLVVCLLTFVRPDAGFVVLIFSMLLSPELDVGATGARAVTLRVDDILLGLVFITWMARLAVRRELSFLRYTPLNGPLMLFIVVCGFATIFGVISGTVQHPKSSLFYLLKYLEYFVLYFMFASQLRNRAQVKLYVMALLITAFIVGCFGYLQIAGGTSRLTAPFEGEHAEPNTLAGYLLLIMALCAGLTLKHDQPRVRLLSLGLCCFLFPPFLMTLSRGGYLGILTTYLVLMWFAGPQHRTLMGVALAVGLMTAPVVIPRRVQERVTMTARVTSRMQSYGSRIWIDPSTRHRLESWPSMMRKLSKRPILGYGVTGAGLMDQQYLLVLGEVGLLGAAVYMWTRWLIWIHALRVFRRTRDDPMAQSLSLGFLGLFAGLMAQSFAGNIFIIVRIMEPFWCVAAMVMVIADVPEEAAKEPQRVVRRYEPPPRLAGGV